MNRRTWNSVPVQQYNGMETGNIPEKIKKKNPSLRKGFSQSESLCLNSFVHLFCQTSLFPIGGVLVDNALGSGFIDYSGSRGQLLAGIGRIGGNSGIELTDRSTQATLDNAIPQILLLTDLYALFCGLDIRQLGSPPLR